MRIILEGTEQEIENLKTLIQLGKVKNLPKIKDHYCLDNLWGTGDVTGNYEDCSEEDAHEILSEALENESVMEQVWNSIDDAAERKGYEQD